MVSDNAQWINNDNNVNLNDNILSVSNDNNANISTNIIKKKIKKIHNIKKFKNNYKNVMELKNIYEPSDELFIEPKFGDILIDYPTNIEHIVEGLTGDGLNDTDEAVIKKKMDQGKNSAYNSIPRPIIDFFGYIYLFLYSPSNYYGKTCVDWMDFGELFKDNPYSENQLNDIEYIDKLLTQPFWYLIMYIPFIILFLLAILLIWLKKCFRVMDDLNIDRPMIFENINDINIFGNANDTNSINTRIGGKTDFNALTNSLSTMSTKIEKSDTSNMLSKAKDFGSKYVKGNTDDDNDDEPSENKETDNLNGTLPIPWFRYTTMLARIIAFIFIIPVKFIKIQILYISIIYIIIILLYIYFYYSIANCNNSNTNTVYVFEIMFCIYAILLVFDIFGLPLYGFITTTSVIETTSITNVSFDYINKLVNSIVEYINNKIKGKPVDDNEFSIIGGKSVSGSSQVEEAFGMTNKINKLLSPVWWFYCFCVTIFFYFMSCFSLIFLPIVLFIEIIKISEIGIMKTIKLYGLYLIQLFSILTFNVVPSLLIFYNRKKIVDDYFNFDKFKRFCNR
jgi:hypothetical protein